MTTKDPFRRAVWSADRQSKSCNSCSRKLGALVFRPIAEFRHHENRHDAEGNRHVQSWCVACRKESFENANGSELLKQKTFGRKAAGLAEPGMVGLVPRATRIQYDNSEKARRARRVEDAKPFWERAR